MPRRDLSGDEARFLASARVGRLATSTPDGVPHAVPVCFVLADGCIYIGLDAKPKSVDLLKLRRVRNITSNPRVSLIVDRYSDDWSRLGFVLVGADASLVSDEGERMRAVGVLRSKYAQYETLLPDDAPVIRLMPNRITSWGDLTPWHSGICSISLDSTSSERSS